METDGFVVIDSPFEPELIREATVAASKLRGARCAGAVELTGQSGFNALVRTPHVLSPEFMRLISSPALGECVARATGSPMLQASLLVVYCRLDAR